MAISKFADYMRARTVGMILAFGACEPAEEPEQEKYHFDSVGVSNSLSFTDYASDERLSSEKPTEVVLPLDSHEAESAVERLDGTIDRILVELPTGKYEVWARMVKCKLITRIRQYDVPGCYKPVGYITSEQRSLL